MRLHVGLSALLTGTMLIGTALPAMAGTGPRSDMTTGHLALGVDPGAFSADYGLTNRLTLGVDARGDDAGSAWGGIGAHATFRLLGAHDGWNLALGGRVSMPIAAYAGLADSSSADVANAVGYTGAVSSYLLLSLPLTSWFILRYPIGMTYYVGAGQNGGQSWQFGSRSWNPNDSRTLGIHTDSADIYLPALQLLPEAAFKFWGVEATLFGTSIAGVRLTF